MGGRLTYWRTALWHLRKGGPKQLRVWLGRQQLRGQQVSALSELVGLRVEVPQGPRRRAVPQQRLRVASILDEFSERAWGEVFDLVPLTPDNWTDQLDSGVEMLFVESAWAGSGGAWRYQLTGSHAPSETLRNLVSHCRERGLPAAFWNKEDPPHYQDFLDTARIFDVVFTTDEAMISKYREDLGHDRIYPLSFAAAPLLHNPIRLRSGHQERDVAFAGTWYAHKFPERKRQLEILLGGALAASPHMDHGLDIYSRFLSGPEQYQFPEQYRHRVVGSLPYLDMCAAYKAYKVFLNVNTVEQSTSMCSRRVFELLASGTPVVSGPSAAIPNFFPADEVVVVADQRETELAIRALVNSPQLRDRMVHLAGRRIWGQHTYAHRADEITRRLGIAKGKPMSQLPKVSVLAATRRPHQLEQLLTTVAAQRGVEVQLVLVSHGFQVPPELPKRARELGISDLVVADMAASSSLGECLNKAVQLSAGEVLAKMDDDDRYGSHYLLDLVHALGYSGADVVGKRAHYMYLSEPAVTLLRYPDREHCWTDLVVGPTITAHRELFEAQPFEDRTRGEDTAWLQAVRGQGAAIYAADRHNFVQVRQGGHTWEVSDSELLAQGVVKNFGLATEDVFL